MIYNIIDNNKDKYIVLIHCVCGNEKIFKNQIQELSTRYNIIIVRLAGHEIESEISEASIDCTINEIYEFILKNKIEKVDILGSSLGAMIASKYATIYPGTVKNLYLEGTIYRFSIHIMNLLYFLLIKIKKFLPRFIYMFLITYILSPYNKQKKQRKALYNYSISMKKEFLFKWMEEMSSFIRNGKNELLSVNNLGLNVKFIYGEKDKIFLNYTYKILSKCNNEDKIVIIPKSGHICNMQNKEDFNNIILKGGE